MGIPAAVTVIGAGVEGVAVVPGQPYRFSQGACKQHETPKNDIHILHSSIGFTYSLRYGLFESVYGVLLLQSQKL